MNYIGIDFGAENILISYIDEHGQIKHIVDNPNKNYIKNYLYVKDNDWMFSYEAKKHSKKGGKFFQRYKHDFPLELTQTLPKEYENYKPSLLTEKMFGYLKDVILKYFESLNTAIELNNTEFVITVPVGWNNNNHAAIYSEALKNNEINKYRLVEEPIAASVSLIRSYTKKIDKSSTIAILDIGSSTTDLTIVTNTNPLKHIKSVKSMTGGDYFDKLVLKEICNKDKPTDNELTKISNYKESEEYDVIIGSCEIDEDKIEENVRDKYVDKLLELFDKVEDIQLNYLIFAGGMSNIRFNILETLSIKISERYNNIQLITDIMGYLRIFAICNGAALLSKDSTLIEYKMNYSIWFIAEIAAENGEKREFEFIEKETTIKENKDKPFYLTRIEDKKRIVMSLAVKNREITIVYKDKNGTTETTLEVPEGIIEDKLYKLKAWFDKQNILHFFLEDKETRKDFKLKEIEAIYNPNVDYLV